MSLGTYPLAPAPGTYQVLERKICEWCGNTFSRVKNSGIRFCKADNIPFPDPARAIQRRRDMEDHELVKPVKRT